MYKIKIFSGGKIIVLQQQINEWLQANKDIVIHNSNVCGSNGENLGSNEYVFFILYSSSIVQQQELKEMAAAAMQEQSVEVKEN
jgi:hypothetical protein